MLKELCRLGLLSMLPLALLANVEGAGAEKELIDGQCQPNPPVNVAANC